MMADISWKNVGTLLWTDLVLARRRILMLCLAVAGGVFALVTFALITGMTFSNMPAEAREFLPVDIHTLQVASALGNSELVVIVASLVVFSRVFANIEKQSNEIRYLMLPASNLEKWLSRVAYVVIVGYVLVQLSSFVGLSLWCGAATLLGSDAPSIAMHLMFHPYEMVRQMGINLPLSMYVSGFGISFFMYTFYIFCGTYYRHNPWLYSLLWGIGAYIALIVVVAVYAIVAIVRGWWLLEPLAGGKMVFDFSPMATWFVAGSIALVLLGVLLLWLSYHKFCRRQLETRRYLTI